MKPLLRGQFHQASFFIALGASSMLLAINQNPRLQLGLFIYTLGLCALFGISALYHRINWPPKRRMWMRRLDHAAIFFMISGTATPLCLVALPQETSGEVLKITWSVAALGIVESLFWVKAPKWVTAFLCVLAGWAVFPYWSEFTSTLRREQLDLLLSGGVIYTLGAVTYALKRPNPSPQYFGYHEIFHVMVMIGAFLHFLMIYDLIKGP